MADDLEGPDHLFDARRATCTDLPQIKRGAPMFARALLAFLVLPGVFGFVVPVLWGLKESNGQLAQPLGLVPMAVGSFALLWCVRDFYVSGKGTLGPWAPPERLVVVGLYRHTRNPMYVAVTLVVIGWAVSFGTAGLYAYAAIVALAFHLRVVLSEEPWLARAHGAQWQEYAGRVPRWFWREERKNMPSNSR